MIKNDQEQKRKYPIAEIFTSIQGEGYWTGQLMTFIRFGGCSVGKPIAEGIKKAAGLSVYTEMCTLYDGRKFPCDTDFRTKEVLTEEQILSLIPPRVKHVCFTGGEPLIHYLQDLIDTIRPLGIMPHIETSGTIPLGASIPQWGAESMFSIGPEQWRGETQPWLTVSPKQSCLDWVIKQANEIKLLVDEQFAVERLPEAVANHHLVWLQPVNFEKSLHNDNLQRCIKLLHEYPTWRLSIQAHKVLGVR